MFRVLLTVVRMASASAERLFASRRRTLRMPSTVHVASTRPMRQRQHPRTNLLLLARSSNSQSLQWLRCLHRDMALLTPTLSATHSTAIPATHSTPTVKDSIIPFPTLLTTPTLAAQPTVLEFQQNLLSTVVPLLSKLTMATTHMLLLHTMAWPTQALISSRQHLPPPTILQLTLYQWLVALLQRINQLLQLLLVILLSSIPLWSLSK